MSAEVTIQSVKALIKQRDDIEAEISALTDILVRGPGLTGNLIDKDGFPRSDIDIPQVRGQRNRLACLKNDLQDITSKIERDMITLHQHARTESQTNNNTAPAPSRPPPRPSPQSSDSTLVSSSGPTPNGVNASMLRPFALVDEVLADSPASTSGLCLGDLLIRFGPVDVQSSSPAEALQTIARLVPQSVGSGIPLVVRRGGSLHSLSLVPQTWSGRGLLGCHLAPVTQ